MKKIFYPVVAVIFVVAVAVVCSCAQTKTNRQLFEYQSKQSIDVVMQILIEKGIDSTAASNYMVCMTETMYLIDSTFFLKGRDYADSLVNNNREKFQQCQKFLLPKDSVQIAPKTEMK